MSEKPVLRINIMAYLIRCPDDFDLHVDIRIKCHSDPEIIHSELVKDIKKNGIEGQEYIEDKLHDMIMKCPSRNLFGS